jgi:hypothetical protein
MKRLFLMIVLFGCALGADQGRGGGDQIGLEFTGLAHTIVDILEKKTAGEFPEVRVSDFKKAIAQTKVIVLEKTYARGVETDASNNGVDLIEVSRTRWKNSEYTLNKRLQIVFHEYLGILGLERDNYNISSRFLSDNPHTKGYSCKDADGEFSISLNANGDYDLKLDDLEHKQIRHLTDLTCKFSKIDPKIFVCMRPDLHKWVIVGNRASNHYHEKGKEVFKDYYYMIVRDENIEWPNPNREAHDDFHPRNCIAN